MSQPVLLWRRPLRAPCAASAGTPRWGTGIPPPASESPVRTGVLGKRLPRELAESLRKVLNRPRGPLLLSCSGTHHAPAPSIPGSLPHPCPPHRAQQASGRTTVSRTAAERVRWGQGAETCPPTCPNLPAPQTQGPSTGGAAGPWSLILPSLVPGPHASRCRGGGRLQGALGTADVCSPLLHRPPGSRPHPRTPR